MRGLDGFACGESAGVKCIANWMDCLLKSRQFCRGIRLVNSFSHWKKLSLSQSRGSFTTVLAQVTRWLADSFITSTILFNLDDSLSLSVVSSLCFLVFHTGMG